MICHMLQQIVSNLWHKILHCVLLPKSWLIDLHTLMLLCWDAGKEVLLQIVRRHGNLSIFKSRSKALGFSYLLTFLLGNEHDSPLFCECRKLVSFEYFYLGLFLVGANPHVRLRNLTTWYNLQVISRILRLWYTGCRIVPELCLGIQLLAGHHLQSDRALSGGLPPL